MNGSELLRVIDAMHRDQGVSKEVIFGTIEKAVRLAILKHYDDEDGVEVEIDKLSGQITAKKGESTLEPGVLGRIAAQAAKQAIIQGIREEVSEITYRENVNKKGDLVQGVVQRFEGGAALISLGRHEALLPRSEQIPGETHHVGERVKAVILDVRKQGHRVKIILSRTHPDFVRQLFEEEIPEIQDKTIEIRAVAREAGYRSKVAVSSIDMKVDCVGACVGVRGSRIKNIIDELGGERIDIVRWNDSLQVLIPNSLQPAAIEEVFLYPRLGRAIVLVAEDQLSLAIGRRGQNVRLASKLVGWDIEIMTADELDSQASRAENWFRELPGIDEDMVAALTGEGFLSYTDLTFLEPAQLAEITGLDEEQAEDVIALAEEKAEEVEPESLRASEESRGQAPQSLKPSAMEAATKLLGGEAPTPPTTEPKLTVESVFGPDARRREPESSRSAAKALAELLPDTPPATGEGRSEGDLAGEAMADAGEEPPTDAGTDEKKSDAP
jgi:N utilization substance protein A